MRALDYLAGQPRRLLPGRGSPRRPPGVGPRLPDTWGFFP